MLLPLRAASLRRERARGFFRRDSSLLGGTKDPLRRLAYAAQLRFHLRLGNETNLGRTTEDPPPFTTVVQCEQDAAVLSTTAWRASASWLLAPPQTMLAVVSGSSDHQAAPNAHRARISTSAERISAGSTASAPVSPPTARFRAASSTSETTSSAPASRRWAHRHFRHLLPAPQPACP